MRADKPVLMSTHGDSSSRNAAESLARPIDLEPIRGRLGGTPAAGVEAGYLWGFKSMTPVMRGADPLRPGDVCVTTTRSDDGRVVVRRLFPVLAVVPDAAEEVPGLLGFAWRGSGWGNVVVLDAPEVLDPPVPFGEIDAAFNVRPGQMWTSKFLKPSVEELLTWLGGRGASPAPTGGPVPHPANPVTTVPPSAGEALRRYRRGSVRFQSAVFGVYGTACAACGFEAARSAAHLKDWSQGGPDEWWNGVPLCPNHHALFDRGLMRLHPQTLQWRDASGLASPPASWGVARPGLPSSGSTPLPEMLEWKWANPVAGR